MKLLLTSSGLRNKSIVNALLKLCDRPFPQLNLAFIPTAANVEKGDKSWLINDLENCRKLGFKQIDIVDISAVNKSIWLPKLEEANILLFGGGNTYHLLYSMRKSGLEKILPNLLRTRVYIGISAGSIITTPSLFFSNQMKKDFAVGIDEYVGEKGFGFVNFYVRPHLNHPEFPHARLDKIEQKAKEVSKPVYAIDDETAIKVDGNKIEVVSEGNWKKIN